MKCVLIVCIHSDIFSTYESKGVFGFYTGKNIAFLIYITYIAHTEKQLQQQQQ